MAGFSNSAKEGQAVPAAAIFALKLRCRRVLQACGKRSVFCLSAYHYLEFILFEIFNPESHATFPIRLLSPIFMTSSFCWHVNR
jgi:hypothetical protein